MTLLATPQRYYAKHGFKAEVPVFFLRIGRLLGIMTFQIVLVFTMTNTFLYSFFFIRGALKYLIGLKTLFICLLLLELLYHYNKKIAPKI